MLLKGDNSQCFLDICKGVRERCAAPLPCVRRFVAKLILIADDNDIDAFAISRTLTNAGIKNKLKRVSDGAEVIAYFKGDGQYADRKKFPLPGILLLDLNMPGIGGFAVLEWLKDRRLAENGTLIVVITGHYKNENLQRACSLGVRSFLIKPCTVHDICTLAQAYPSYWQTDLTRESLGIPSIHSRAGGSIARASA